MNWQKIIFTSFIKGMAIKVNFTNYEKCYPKRLKTLFRSNLNSQQYEQIIPNMKRAVVGNLPPELINFLPKDAHAIKNFQDALSDITRYLRGTHHQNKYVPGFSFFDENYQRAMFLKNWMANATNLFNKRIARFDGLNADINFVDRASFGNVFRITFKDKNGKQITHDKALKVYHYIKEPIKNNVPIHGNYAEANFWEHLKQSVGHNMNNLEFSRHYISDLHSGYALTEFLDKNVHKPTTGAKWLDLLGIASKDKNEFNSPIYGKLFDVGNMVKLPDFIDDKVVLRYYKKLFFRNPQKDLQQTFNALQIQAQNPKNEHHSKIQKAIDLFKQHHPQRVENLNK